MKKKKQLYPGIPEAEKERCKMKPFESKEDPDFINGKPNYDKFKGKDPTWVLAYLNID